MANIKTEPVRHTCPDIDRIMNTIKSIVNDMDSMCDSENIEDIKNSISDWSGEIGSIGIGHNCELENLRSANSSLREWGQELYDQCNSIESEMQKEIDELNEKIDNLKYDLSHI